MKNFLPKQLRIMLNAMEAQHFREYMSADDKRAALDKVLAGIESDAPRQQAASVAPMINTNRVSAPC